MTHTDTHIEDALRSQEAFGQMVKERLQYAVRVTLMSVLEEEVTAFIGATPYERGVQRPDQRNGHYTRDLETTMGQIADLPVPRTRGGYQTQVFQRYHRRQDELDGARGEMFVRVSQHREGRRGHRDADRFPSQRLKGFACFPYLRKRVRAVETTPPWRAIGVCICRWDVLERHLQWRGL